MDIRSNIRRQLERNATIICKGVKSKITDKKAQKFRDYFDWSESLNRCPSHRFLAILRAENEGIGKQTWMEWANGLSDIGAELVQCSTDHDAGQQLLGLGGVVALLRYAM
jgi:hypothetical protein